MQLVRSISLAALLTAGTISSGCASAGSFAQEPNDGPQPINRSLLSARGGIILPAEITATASSTVYEAVFKLRPGFFTSKRAMGTARASIRPAVIVGYGSPEPLEVLRLISIDAVAEIRFIEPSDAAIRYGSAYSAGLIVVRLRGSAPTPFE